MFAVGEGAGVGCVRVLFVTEDAGKPRLAAARVRVGVDRQAGSMNAPEGGGGGGRGVISPAPRVSPALRPHSEVP